MAHHTPQWRLDMRLMLETLEMARKVIENCDHCEDELRAIDLAIKLGERY